MSMPLLGVGIAFANSGIHTAISKYVASASTSSKASPKRYLWTGLTISLALGLVYSLPVYVLADVIALKIFHQATIAPLLRILVLCVPLECIHGCINGYYYGLQRAAIPSGGQCVEQLVRVGSVFGIYYILTQSGSTFTKTHAMIGLVIGEAVATLYYITILSLEGPTKSKSSSSFSSTARQILNLAYPLTATRLSLTFLTSFENIMIPLRLVAFGLNKTQALSIYGIYSGMAVPMVFFPTVLSNSIAVMLLPSISKAKQEGRHKYIQQAILISFFLCMLLGFLFAFFFYFFGGMMGERIFHNDVAGIYIKTLGWLCPFLFLGVTMNSILNGLGKTKDTFCISISGALLRLGFILFGIHRLGFRAFLLGVLLSQILSSFAAYVRLLHHCNQSKA